MFREVIEWYSYYKYYTSFLISLVAELSSFVILSYLLLSGDVELNPGPKIGEN